MAYKVESRNLPVDKLAEVKEEIGDVMIYLTELADKLGIGTVEAAKAKVAPPPHDPTSGIRAKRLVHTPFFFT